MNRIYRLSGPLTLSWLIGSCGGGADSVVGPPPPPVVASVAFASDTATLVPAATIQLAATAKSASGELLQRTFSWSTSDGTKATVSSAGVVAGVAPGSATITAAVEGKSATATITVMDGGVISSSGGTLNAESGSVQIIVPADAITSSSGVAISVAQSSADDPRLVKGAAFDFGPNGTSFAKPVALKVKYDPSKLPAGTEEAALETYL